MIPYISEHASAIFTEHRAVTLAIKRILQTSTNQRSIKRKVKPYTK